jgi:hypothetical protein
VYLHAIRRSFALGVTPFPGSMLDRKITANTISDDRDAPAPTRKAVYAMPLA